METYNELSEMMMMMMIIIIIITTIPHNKPDIKSMIIEKEHAC